MHSLWAPLMTSCIYPGKHVNVSFSNKERQNITSKRKKKELETPTRPPSEISTEKWVDKSQCGNTKQIIKGP